MVTEEITEAKLSEMKAIFLSYRDRCIENRINGTALLQYLQMHYELREIKDKETLSVVSNNIMMNEIYFEKIPVGATIKPRAFYVVRCKNVNKNVLLQNEEEKKTSRIFVGIDECTGYYLVEGSSWLHDELNAIRGLDKKDLRNFVIVAQYIQALKRMHNLEKIINQY